MMNDYCVDCGYVHPIGYVEKKLHELVFDENEEYESGDCYSDDDDEDDDDDYLFENSSGLSSALIIIKLKGYFLKLSAGLHGRYTNSYVYDKTKPHLLGQKLKLWVRDKDRGLIELYFIAESREITFPWRGYDYSNDYMLMKYTQEVNIEDHSGNTSDLTWTKLKLKNVKLQINNPADLLKIVIEHYNIRNQLKLDAAKSHIKLDMQKLKKDKLYMVYKFPYVDNITKKKKTVDYQIIKIWELDEASGKYIKMYYIMPGTNDKLYGRWIGKQVKDQTKTIDPISKEDVNQIVNEIPFFDEYIMRESATIIPSGINNLVKKIAEHYYTITHSKDS